VRLALGRVAADRESKRSEEIRSGDLAIDEATYQAKVGGAPLDLTFKEFELLKFLAQHPGRVFTRAQLLQEVWGYDYFGGTRTVDVHVRRLRAKLGPEREALIGTVRNVGYKFVAQAVTPLPDSEAADVTG
jgi:DNA-binding response OmpR family regulator